LSESDSNSHIQRLAPVKQTITINQHDISNANFIVFQKLNTFALTGVVNTTSELLSSVKVYLYEESNLDSPVHTISLGYFKFFEFPALKRKNYVVKLETSLSSKTHDIKASSVTVIHDGSPRQHVELSFFAKEKHIDMVDTQSVWTLPFAVALIFICYNYDTALLLLMRLNKFIQNFNNRRDENGRASVEEDSDEDSSKLSRKKRR
jgi:hypothetical protein